MSRRNWRAGLVVAALAAALGGPPAVSGEPGSVASGVAAEVLAIRDVRVPAEVSGRVVRRPADENATVAAGEVVVELDGALLEAAARSAEASLRRASARLEFARLERKRVADLRASGAVGEAELDRADVAQREADATLAAADAALAEVRTRLERTRIVAPFAGRLVRVPPEAGEYLATGQTAFRIVDVTSLRIVAYVSAAWLARLDVGTALEVASDTDGLALPVLRTKVRSVAPAAEGRARTFRVEARATDASGRWRPGMTARLRLAREVR